MALVLDPARPANQNTKRTLKIYQSGKPVSKQRNQRITPLTSIQIKKPYTRIKIEQPFRFGPKRSRPGGPPIGQPWPAMAGNGWPCPAMARGRPWPGHGWHWLDLVGLGQALSGHGESWPSMTDSMAWSWLGKVGFSRPGRARAGPVWP